MTSVLQFLPLAISFHIPGVDCLLRKILLLVWTQSTNIHKELIEVEVGILNHSIDNEIAVFL